MDVSMIPQSVHVSRKYSREKILEAAVNYIVTGVATKAAELTGIPDRTLQCWIKTDWWPDLIAEARKEAQEEIDAMAGRVMKKALLNVEDRLEKGDVVPIKVKKGSDQVVELVRKPVSARDCAIVGSIWFDKQRILRNQPTSITSSSNEALAGLADRIREIEERQEAKVISDQ